MENENIRRDDTKGKIILFVIGVLLGAVIASAAFLISVNTLGVDNNGGASMQMPGGGTPPEMPSGNNGQSEQNGQSGSSESSGSSGQSGQNQQGQPPEKPSNDNKSESQ